MWLQLRVKKKKKNLYLSPPSKEEQTEMKWFPAADLGLCLSNLSERWFLRAKFLQRCLGFAGSSLPLSTLFSPSFLSRQKPASGNKSWERQQERTWKISFFFDASQLHLDNQEPSWISTTPNFSTENQTGEENRSKVSRKSDYFLCSAQPANPQRCSTGGFPSTNGIFTAALLHQIFPTFLSIPRRNVTINTTKQIPVCEAESFVKFSSSTRW